ncbi:MAG: PD-(D/E)XK nuclease family protein, partial [Rhodobacteraceae bacterium]|nr:PD-(D/E)XK nuclease family protein [Paracoccaceae bacterium]
EHLAAHRAVAVHLSRGADAGAEAGGGADDGADGGALLDGAAGQALAGFLEALARAAPHGPDLSPGDYAALFRAALAREGAVREAVIPDARVELRGTIEARTLGADLVILAGLSEGVWPALPPPDPWLSRAMRQAAGLLSPERRVGLQAHDFQQAAGAPEVVLARSLRDAEAPLVPARWLNRLTGLLEGLGPRGRSALEAMRARGAGWVDMARAMDRPAAPLPAAPRPAPRPPVAARPTRLSVTEVQHLIRDPYALYARHVLRLAPLRPLRPEPDALLRGIAIHTVMERFVDRIRAALPPPEETIALLMAEAAAVLEAEAPFPAVRRLWLRRLERAAPGLVAQEQERRMRAAPLAQEAKGEWLLSMPDGARITLVGKADRVDIRPDGALEMYDYKTGAPPTAPQIRHFDRQLPLLALMAEAGLLGGVPARPVVRLAHIAIGAQAEEKAAADDDEALRALITGTEAGLMRLLAAYRRPDQGFASRRAVDRQARAGDYDQLARFGEWSLSDPARPEDVG